MKKKSFFDCISMKSNLTILNSEYRKISKLMTKGKTLRLENMSTILVLSSVQNFRVISKFLQIFGFEGLMALDEVVRVCR